MRFAGSYAILLAATLAVLVVFGTSLRYAPPEPLPESATPTEFSAVRARGALLRVLGDEAPHPAGSDGAIAIRSRIEAELTKLGVTWAVRPGFACRGGSCGFSANLLAEIKGASDDAVLLSAHYDSVAAGPGAGDDGTGVATLLEIARALRASPPLARSVLFLFDEGEEDGLLGARAFVKEPEFSRIRAAVNVDARGNGGPAILFETSVENAAAVRAIASRMQRPVTSSALFPAYATMPNSTDFTVWKAEAPQLQGVNFALLGDIGSYHTPLDRAENVDVASLQHEGDGALAMTRGLAEADLSETGSRVWFDVFAARVVVWPLAWATRIAGTSLALVVLAIAARLVRKRITPFDFVRGLGALPFAIVGATAIGVSLTSTLLSSGVVPARWTANAPLLMAAMWTIGVALAGAVTAWLSRDVGEDVWCGVWFWIALAGVVLAWKVPVASHVVTIPTAFAGILGIATAWPAREDVGDGALLLASTLPALVMLALWAPAALLIYDAMGVNAAPNVAIVSAILACTFAPVFALATPQIRWILPGILAIGALATTALAARAAPFTRELPSRANVVVVVDDRAAHALVDTTWGSHTWGPVPWPMRTALGMARENAWLPWSANVTLGTDLPHADLATPVVETLTTAAEGAERRITLRLRSPRGARTLALLLPPEAHARFAGANGIALDPQPVRAAWRELRVVAVPAAGVTVDVLATYEPLTVAVYDETAGVPPSAAAIVAARPPTAVPTQRGDITLVTSQATL